ADCLGNVVGPGRLGSFTVEPAPGSNPVGSPSDNGDGSYTVDVVWDPASADAPGIIVVQPEHPPVVIAPPSRGRFSYSVKFVCGVQKADPCCCAPVAPGGYSTEINIHNFQNRDVKIEKHVLPIVFAGAATGREPKVVKRRAFDSIVLPA